MNLVRTQILLTPEQLQHLRRIAHERQKSVSAVVREILARALVESEAEARRRRRQMLLSRLQAASDALAQSGFAPLTGDEIVDLVRQMREERTDDLVDHLLGA